MPTELEGSVENGWSYFDLVEQKTPTEMVREYARVSGQKPDVKLYDTLIDEEFAEWGAETEFGLNLIGSGSGLNIEGEDYNPAAELKELADLLYVIYGYANARGWDVEEALKRVHDNNMGRMRQPDGTIKRREDGKVIKWEGYPKVDLSDLVL
jgi:NTP pyrophosphatase (non-canonical NTP hydrolase)